MDENTREAFQEWKADADSYGDLSRDYFNYVDRFVEEEVGSADELMTFDEFAQDKYREFLLEMHKDDELDDEEEPFPDLDE